MTTRVGGALDARREPRPRPTAWHDHAGRARLDRRLRESAPSNRSPRMRDEQLARRQRARVDRHAGELACCGSPATIAAAHRRGDPLSGQPNVRRVAPRHDALHDARVRPPPRQRLARHRHVVERQRRGRRSPDTSRAPCRRRAPDRPAAPARSPCAIAVTPIDDRQQRAARRRAACRP